ncbi:MAG: restriction endonuclease [Thermoanaerobaculia bacterium]
MAQIQSDYDHGVFLTTSRFSSEAKQASYKKGAITILLLDGAAIADILVERGLGVRRLPLYVYDVDEESSTSKRIEATKQAGAVASMTHGGGVGRPGQPARTPITFRSAQR